MGNIFLSFLNSRKGQGLPIETIIVIVILLIVLVMIIIIFTGQADTIFETVSDFLGIARDSGPVGNLSEMIQ
jgi:hypothetical protein